MTKTGLLGDAFFVTYMISAPILGLLADRILAMDHRRFRCDFMEPGQRRLRFGGDVRHSVCDSHLRWNWRRRLRPGCADNLVRSFPDRNARPHHGDFCAAIPVGSALGYVIGGLIGAHLGWRWAFYLVAPPGLLLGLLCFWQRDPRVAAHRLVQESPRRSLTDYLRLFRTRSYLINCIAQTLMTFVTGGLGFWVSAYLRLSKSKPSLQAGRSSD